MAKNTNNWYLSLLRDRYPDYTEGAFTAPPQQATLGLVQARTFAPPNPVARRQPQSPDILKDLMTLQAAKSGQALPPGTNPASMAAILGQLFPKPVPQQPQKPLGEPSQDAENQPGGFYGESSQDAEAQQGGFYGEMPQPVIPPEYQYFDQDQLYG